MEETIQTTEPTIVETEPTMVETTEPTVVEQPTPMDDNVTYNTLPDSATRYDPNLDAAQNMANQIVKVTGAINAANNSGNAMNRFLTKEYNYNPEEAGSYWVAGGINDKDTQMSFLNTIINEEMYDEMDLQKYYYDNTMATARAYAANKEKETAYGFYRAAQEKAISEAQLTGWYMPAEGQYMLANYEAAQATINNKDSSPEAIAKAKRVSGVAEQWFAANKISTRGMKCLSMMNYEESVRHNTIMGELKKEANKIAAAGNAISAAGNELKLREFKFRMEEAELDQGINYTNILGLDNEKNIGHDPNDPLYDGMTGLRNYTDMQHALADPRVYNSILNAYGRNYLKNLLDVNGLDSVEYELSYQGDNQRTNAQSYIDSNTGTNTIPPGYCTEATGKTIKVDGKDYELHIGYFKDSDGKQRVFAGIMYDDNSWRPLTEGNYYINDSDGKTVEQYINDRFKEGVADFSGVNTIKVNGKEYYIGSRPKVDTNTSYNTMINEYGWVGRQYNANDKDIKRTEKQYGTGFLKYNYIDDTDKLNGAIEKALSAEGLKEKGTNKVHSNLTLMDGWMDQDNWNQYVLFRDDYGNMYRMNSDYTLSYIDKKSAKDLKYVGWNDKTMKKGTKVGETGPGDSTADRIYKGSYKVSELTADNGKTYATMCYINRDGNGNIIDTHYYEVVYTKRNVTTDLTTGEKTLQEPMDVKINKTSLTEDEVIARGGTPIKSQEQRQQEKDAETNNNKVVANMGDTQKDVKVPGVTEENSSVGDLITQVSRSSGESTYDAMSTETNDAYYDRYELYPSDTGANLLEDISNFGKTEDEEKKKTINDVSKEG